MLKKGGDDNHQCHCDEPPNPTHGKSVSLCILVDYVVYHWDKFHNVLSTILLRFGLSFFQVNHSFLYFAVDHFNTFTINLLVCSC